MPTVLREQGFQFYFYSHETTEPPHVHVDKGGASCKYWLSPVLLARNHGFSDVELNRIRGIILSRQDLLLANGMSTLAGITDERVSDVKVSPESLTVFLADGRVLSVPLFWYPRLARASQQQRERWESCGAGFGVYWPDLDEHLSVEGLLRGSPSPLSAGKTSE